MKITRATLALIVAVFGWAATFGAMEYRTRTVEKQSEQTWKLLQTTETLTVELKTSARAQEETIRELKQSVDRLNMRVNEMTRELDRGR